MIKKFLLLMPIIILSLFFVNIAPAFAADDIDMNLTSNETSNTMATASTYQPTTSSTYSTTSSSGLDISNILNILLIMELEELRDALKIASEREYALIEELLVCVDKKKFD